MPGTSRPHDQRTARKQARPSAGRARFTAAALAGLAILVLSAGCAGGTSSPGAAAGTPSAGSAVAQGLRYTQCMRAHGIADFPDPDSNGQFALSANGPGSDLLGTNPKYQAAETACKSLQPAGATPTQQEQNYQAALRYAHCMQGRGIDVPDPAPPGTGASQNSSTGSPTAGSGANPSSPQYIAANKACEHYLPAGQQPGLSSGGGGS